MKILSIALPYLLLVSFYSGQFNNFGIDKIKAISESPYDGVAVALIGAYDTGKYSENDFEMTVRLLKKESKKHIWPWVFFNRFNGFSPEEGIAHSGRAGNKPYFKQIKGMDIYNDSGALEDFYNIWRISLKIAKRLGSPGIVVDPEAYNNYKNYQLSYLSRQIGKPEEEIKKRLKDMGAELAEKVTVLAEGLEITRQELKLTRGEVGGLSRTMSYAFENEAFRMLPGILKRKYNIEITEKLIREEVRGKEINIFGKARRNAREILCGRGIQAKT